MLMGRRRSSGINGVSHTQLGRLAQANVQPGYTFNSSTGAWDVAGTSTPAYNPSAYNPTTGANSPAIAAPVVSSASQYAPSPAPDASVPAYDPTIQAAPTIANPTDPSSGIAYMKYLQSNPSIVTREAQDMVSLPNNTSVSVPGFNVLTATPAQMVAATQQAYQTIYGVPYAPAIVSSGIPAGGAPTPTSTYGAAKQAAQAGAMTQAQLQAGMQAGNQFWDSATQSWQLYTGYYNPSTGSSAAPSTSQTQTSDWGNTQAPASYGASGQSQANQQSGQTQSTLQVYDPVTGTSFNPASLSPSEQAAYALDMAQANQSASSVASSSQGEPTANTTGSSTGSTSGSSNTASGSSASSTDTMLGPIDVTAIENWAGTGSNIWILAAVAAGALFLMGKNR